MKTRDFFNPRKVAEKAKQEFDKGTEEFVMTSSNGACQMVVKPVSYSVYIEAYDTNTGLDCEDVVDFEELVEDIYTQL